MTDDIKNIEKEIDEAFKKNLICNMDISSAIWTLLSVLEDMFFKIRCIDRQTPSQIYMWTDVMLNSVTHPLRILFSNQSPSLAQRVNKYVSEEYEWAYYRLQEARQYNEFCTIFPLYYKGCVTFSIQNRFIKVARDTKEQFQYEAYNRIRKKEGCEIDNGIDFAAITELLWKNVSFEGETFDIHLNKEIITKLVAICSAPFNNRFVLPSDWRTNSFTLGNFKNVFETIQAILIGRLLVRDKLAQNRFPGIGYSSIVWTISKNELLLLINSATSICVNEVESIVDFLTFGRKGIRNPDIATQPIIDLGDGKLIFSTFIMMNVDAERNLCVLLNKVEDEKTLYSKLVNEKESILRQEITEFVRQKKLGYDIRYGDLGSTDLDIAIIDRLNRICICMELKWFIEPADVDEIVNRTQELEKGKIQSKEILRLYRNKDNRLINGVLQIDEDFDFLVTIGSRNWIGNSDVQVEEIPIIKVFHFLEKLNELRDLKLVANWLINRDYLPIENVDYEVIHFDVEIGKWKSNTYGFNLLR